VEWHTLVDINKYKSYHISTGHHENHRYFSLYSMKNVIKQTNSEIDFRTNNNFAKKPTFAAFSPCLQHEESVQTGFRQFCKKSVICSVFSVSSAGRKRPNGFSTILQKKRHLQRFSRVFSTKNVPKRVFGNSAKKLTFVAFFPCLQHEESAQTGFRGPEKVTF